MEKKDLQKKIASCKALRGVTVEGLVMRGDFLENLEAYMRAQRDDREAVRRSYEAMRRAGGLKGYRVPAHAIDRLMELDAEGFRDEFLLILKGASERPRAEREYIRQLGMQAYNLTVARIVCEEFPEARESFFPDEKLT